MWKIQISAFAPLPPGWTLTGRRGPPANRASFPPEGLADTAGAVFFAKPRRAGPTGWGRCGCNRCGAGTPRLRTPEALNFEY